jgi:cell division septation protein DedD
MRHVFYVLVILVLGMVAAQTALMETIRTVDPVTRRVVWRVEYPGLRLPHRAATRSGPAPSPTPAKASPSVRPTVLAEQPPPVPKASESPTTSAEPRPIAERLQVPASPPATKRTEAPPGPTDFYIVQVAVVPTRIGADRLSTTLSQAGFHPYLVRIGEGFAVRLGAFRQAANAQHVARQAHGRKFPAAILHRPQE